MFKLSRFLRGFAFHVFLCVISLICLFPLYFLFVSSFKTSKEYILNPYGLSLDFTLQNFIEVIIEKGFLRHFLNSSTLMAFSTIFSLILACLAAYAFAKFTFKGKNKVFSAVVSLMGIPPIIVIVPLFVLMARLKLLNTYQSVVLIYMGFIIPFSMFILTNFFTAIPNEMLEAARIDGCSRFWILLKIILPLSKAPLITLFIVNGLWVWNDLLIALIFLQKRSMRTLMAQIALHKGRYVMNVPVVMAASAVAIIPMLIIYMIGQRFFVKGLVGGTGK